MSKEDKKLLETYKLQLDQINELLQNDPNNEEYLSMRDQLDEAISLLKELTSDKPVAPTKPFANPIEWKLGDVCQVKLPKFQNQWISANITSFTADKSISTIIIQKSHETIQVPTHQLRHPKNPDIPSHTDTHKSMLTKKQLEEQRKKRKKAQLEYQERKDQEHSSKADAWKSFQTRLVNKSSPSIFHPAQRESIFKTCTTEKPKTTSIVTKRKHIYTKDIETE